MCTTHWAIIKYSCVLYVQYVDKQCVYLYVRIIYVGGNFREVELLFLPEFRRRNFEFTFPRPQQRTIHHSLLAPLSPCVIIHRV